MSAGSPRIAKDRRAQQADGAAAAELPLGAEHGVARQRLDLCLDRPVAVRQLRELAPRDGLERAERPAAAGAPDDLGGAEDGGPARDVHVPVVHLHLRISPDAAAVVERRLGPEEPPVLAGAAAAEIAEDLGALREERPPLLEEGLELREVDDGGVHLDLAEVRVERGIEGEAGRQAVLEIEAGAGEETRSVVEGRSLQHRRDELLAGRHVRQQLQRRGRVDAGNALETGHLRRQAGLVLADKPQPRRFVAALDDALDVDAPRVAVGVRKAQLRERDAHLEGPSACADFHRRRPHGVPGRVEEIVVVDERVALDPGRRHAELRASQAGVVRIEVDDNASASTGRSRRES